MSDISIEKFAAKVNCRRILKARIGPDVGDGLRRIPGGKPWAPSQEFLETDQYVFVAPDALRKGNPLEMFNNIREGRAFALVPLFETDLVRGAPGRLVTEDWSEPLILTDLDKAINVAQDIGRWDMAVMLVLSLFGFPALRPESIQWAGFPHTSRMAFVFDGGGEVGWRGYIPSGAAKQVLEYWWTAAGGYHAESIWLPPPSEYDAFMASVRNPWHVIGVTPHNVLDVTLLPVQHIRPALEWDRRIQAVGSNAVGYRGDENGTLRPYYYVTGAPDGAPTPERQAWDRDLRMKVIKHMDLPPFVMREILKV